MSNAPKRRRVTVYVFDGEDLDQLSQLRQAVNDAKPAAEGAPRLASDPDGEVAAREAYNAFYAEAKERATKVTLQALPRLDWRRLSEAHPPREIEVKVTDDEGNETGETETEQDPRDLTHGVNDETMPDALLGYINADKPTSRAIVDPELEQTELTEFLEELSDSDFYRMYSVALMLNVVSADPKALPVFSETPTSDET